MEINLPNEWNKVLEAELNANYFKEIINKLIEDKRHGISIFPNENSMLQAFNLCSFEQLKVVIVGQDPYHGEGQANGLAFSVGPGIKVPPSLKNIYKELHSELEIQIPNHGDLSHWAKQGVLLLNSALTVQANNAGSHSKIGWHQFTDAVIKLISGQKKNIVFILWGAHARSKKGLIDTQKHLVLESAHPSPLSAHNGFWGTKPFSKTNEYLIEKGKTGIDWQV